MLAELDLGGEQRAVGPALSAGRHLGSGRHLTGTLQLTGQGAACRKLILQKLT
jgi:hypothetical protein